MTAARQCGLRAARFSPKATAAVRLHRARLASIAGSWPKTEAATSADFQRAHAPPSARCGAHSVLSQRMRAAWSAALAIVMLSIGSNCTTQSCGCAASSDISHDEPELDSKRTTKGTGGGNGSAVALATLASGGSAAVLVLARGGAYDSFHAAAMLQLQQLTNWRTGVLGGKASLVTQCAKVEAVCQPVCANVSLSIQERVHACARTAMHM